MKVAKLFKEVRRQATRFVAPHSVERTSLYADYEGWLRTDLRSWAESILFDERTQDRGIFRREALVSLWARHMTGNELWTIGKIASIITFEMMLRSFNL
jgi:asparagine synthase (glutamine-hydrolysing)